jgi:hypothetical protein
MKWRSALACLSVLAALPVAQTKDEHLQPCTLDKRNGFVLTVLLQDPYNSRRELRMPVRVGMHFEVSDVKGSVRNTISGDLYPCTRGTYPLRLTGTEWFSEKSNISDTTEYRLHLGEPQSGGVVSSFIYSRTVTLRQEPNVTKTNP